jgi:hypothetical protein
MGFSNKWSNFSLLTSPSVYFGSMYMHRRTCSVNGFGDGGINLEFGQGQEDQRSSDYGPSDGSQSNDAGPRNTFCYAHKNTRDYRRLVLEL